MAVQQWQYNIGCLKPTESIMKQTFYLSGHEYIALCDLLKHSAVADSGGQAKAWIAQGLVLRNGAVETRKTAKIRAGEVVACHGAELTVEPGHDPAET